MKVGFTGTQKGMTDAQKDSVRKLLRTADELHHGDCVGADADAHRVALSLGLAVVVHPPDDDKKRFFCVPLCCEGSENAATVLPPKPYLTRNKDIVRDTQWLLACPGEVAEVIRSGTWATVRAARKAGKNVVIVCPDGRAIKETNKPKPEGLLKVPADRPG